jgi:hypothetical protein
VWSSWAQAALPADTFKRVATPGGSAAGLNAIAGLSTSDVWAVGSTGSPSVPLVIHWNGSQFQQVATSGRAGHDRWFSGVSPVPGSTNTIWAVGGQQDYPSTFNKAGLIERHTSQGWQVFAPKDVHCSPPSCQWELDSVHVFSQDQAIAVGSTPTADSGGGCIVLVWDGQTWTRDAQSAQLPVDCNDAQIAAESPQNFFIVGENFADGVGGDGVIVHDDGSQWTAQVFPAYGAFTGVSEVGNTDMFVASSIGLHTSQDASALFWVRDDGQVIKHSVLRSMTVFSIAASTTEIWVSGANSQHPAVVEERDAAGTWHRQLTQPAGADLESIAHISGSGTTWTVGDDLMPDGAVTTVALRQRETR